MCFASQELQEFDPESPAVDVGTEVEYVDFEPSFAVLSKGWPPAYVCHASHTAAVAVDCDVDCVCAFGDYYVGRGVDIGCRESDCPAESVS